MLQQVTQETIRVLTRFNEIEQRNELPRTRSHISIHSLESMRTRAQNSKCRMFTKNSTNRPIG